MWCDWAKGRPCQGNVSFPDPQRMVDKAKSLGLSPGWYLNNCGCNEHQFEGEMVTTIMQGSVKALVDMGWEGLKLDSCSQFNNLSWWNALINQTSKAPVLLENCHQGGFSPGMIQWQGYLRNASAVGGYSHRLGYFSAGHDMRPPLLNTSYQACRAECEKLRCFGFCFESDELRPAQLPRCYVKGESHFQPMDLSSSNHCTGTSAVSDCPYNLYRTSGDIGTYWDRVLSNLDSTVPFLGDEQRAARSRPGAWAFPDMLEVGRLRNFSESRTHFSAWAVMSSPLILSFDLRVETVMTEMWPVISNRDVIAVNQRWDGSPGQRLGYTGAVDGNVGNSSQTWAKRLGDASHAVLFMSTGPEPAHFSLPFRNISAELVGAEIIGVCIRNLYTKEEAGPLDPRAARLEATVLPHDSAFYCVRPAAAGGCSAYFRCPSFKA